MQQRFAEARRASALRAVARSNGKAKRRRLFGLLPRRVSRDVDVHEFRPTEEDVWKAIRF